MQAQSLIDMEDAVVVTRDAKGAPAAAPGREPDVGRRGEWRVLGHLIGILFLNPLLGAAMGAGWARWPASSLTSASTINS